MNRTLALLAGIVTACVLGALAIAWPFLSAMRIGFFEALGAVLR